MNTIQLAPTKATIVQRLLEAKQITAEEAVILLMADSIKYLEYVPVYPNVPPQNPYPLPYYPIPTYPNPYPIIYCGTTSGQATISNNGN